MTQDKTENQNETEHENPEREIPRWKAVLRWIAVFPSAVIASALFVMFSRPSGEDSNIIIISVMEFLRGAAFVYVGVIVAPSNKKVVSYVLSVLAILLSGAALFSSLVVLKDYMTCVPILVFVAGIVVGNNASIETIENPKKQQF